MIGVSAGRFGLHVKRGNMSEDSGVLLRLQFGSVIRVEEECPGNSYFDARLLPSVDKVEKIHISYFYEGSTTVF